MSHKPVSPSMLIVVAVLLAVGWLPAGLGAVAQEGTAAQVTSDAPLDVALVDASGTAVGSATFAEKSGGVAVTVSVQGLPPGEHGIHVHAMGVCDPGGADPFASAGPHYNPTGAAHGGPPASPAAVTEAAPVATPGAEAGHFGDLGNIAVGDDGSGQLEVVTDRFTLLPGPTSLFDEDGSSLLIHANPDDLQSDPAGESGSRIVCGLVAAPLMAETPAGTPSPVTVTGHVVNPERRAFDEALLGQLQAPEGFTVTVFAQQVGNARMMAVGPDGTVYVTRPDANDVMALRDQDGDGRAEEATVVASNLRFVHGITIHEDRLYLAGETSVWVADLRPGGEVGEPRVLIDGLPDGDQHYRRTIAVGPDGMLYVSIGSSCNNCRESNRENAALLRANVDGDERTVFAMGLRNTIGWGWHPETRELWGMDHGSDWRGDDQPPEELNRIEEGRNYGWPYCFGDRQVDVYGPQVPQGSTSETYCALTEAPVLTYQAHSAPIGMAFYTADQFPADYQNDAFVAMRGSWNRFPATGYKVVRVHFEDGQPVAIDDFVTGWLLDDGAAHFGRIAGLAVAADGSLLISEDTNGIIYRVTYTGDGTS